jgi:outer membrane receptor protein involved in Fe transport
MNLAKWNLGLLAGVFALAIPAACWAQQAPKDELTDIIVTGSRVVTNGNAAPTPVTVITSTDLEALSPLGIADALETLPQFNGSSSPSRNSYTIPVNESTATNLDLRNLGPQRVLTLFDGMRLVPEANTGLVDASLIPQMLVQRVDVVTGGASAAYGSDAVSGVVDFILDKKFTGVSYLAQGGISQQGDDKNGRLGIAAGENFLSGRLHLEGSAEYSHSDGIGAVSDRPLGQNNSAQLGLLGAKPTPGTAANPFAYLTGVQNLNLAYGGYLYPKTGNPNNGTIFGPGGTLIAPVDGTVIGSNCVNCNFTSHDPNLVTLIPYDSKDQFFARADFEATDHINFFVQGLYADARAGENTDGTISRPSPTTAFSIYGNNAYLNQISPTLAASIPASGDYLSRMSIDLGGANSLTTNNSTYMVTLGANGDIFERFKWDVDYSYSHSQQSLDLYNLDNVKTRAALDAVVNPATGQIVCNVTLTNPGAYPGCVPLNLFGQGSASAAAIAYIHGDALQQTDFDQNVVEANLRGDLFNVWAGPVTGAVGAAYRTQTYTQTSNSNPATFVAPVGIRGFAGDESVGGNFGVGGGSEKVAEFYGETLVPVLKDVPFAKSLDFNGAYRYTHYSVSGGVSTWKYGLVWQPIDDLRFRAGRSRDIRAPTLIELYQGASYANAGNFTDPHSGTPISALLTITEGNRNLKPEISDTTTVGFVVEPTEIPGLSASLDYYNIHIAGAIGSPYSAAQILQVCENSGGTDPTCALITRPDAFSDHSAANNATAVEIAPLNVAVLKVAGIDIEGNYHRPIFGGQFLGRAIFNVPTQYEQVNSPGQAPVNYLGNMDLNQSLTLTQTGIPRYEGTIILGYAKGPVAVTIDEQLISSLHRTDQYFLADHTNSPAIQYTGLSIAYQFTDVPSKPSLFLKIDNLFDTNPPFYYQLPAGQPGDAINANRSLYDIVGRTYTLGIRGKF